MAKLPDFVTDDAAAVEIGRKLFSWRDYTPIPLAVLLIFVSEPTAISATIGIILVQFGELIRIYSVAFIGTISRTRSNSTGPKLVTSGPFQIVRNPLYVGNFFITMGIAAFGGSMWFTCLTVALFCVQYFYIVKYEESNLTSKFGDEYRLYCERVPAWIPKNRLTLDDFPLPDSITPALKSEKRTLTAIGLAILLLSIKSL